MNRWAQRALPLLVAGAAAGAQAPDKPSPAAIQLTPEILKLRAERSGAAGRLNTAEGIWLAGADRQGRPVYYEQHSQVAAQSLRLDALWPGGSSGLNLTGQGISTLGAWDSGAPRPNHQEYAGRVLQQDDAFNVTSHSTAVAAILVGQGLAAGVRGMAPAAGLKFWDWNDDQLEMQDAAWRGLTLSNHSYGASTGFGLVGSSWYWYGDPAVNPVEDANFGAYTATSAWLDEVVHEAPRWLLVRSAGNHRFDTGPAEGVPHFVYTDSGWEPSFERRDPDGGANGFDSLPPEAVAKNSLVVGSVGDIPSGWTSPASVVLTTYTSFGPTDDGRIKPDVVANGVALLTAARTGDAEYTSFSGTSAAAPTVAGAAALLANLYGRGHSSPGGQPLAPLSSTLRGLLIHTADEAGPADGPDYQAGWGLVDALTAAQLLVDDNSRHRRVVEGRALANTSRWVNLRSLGGPVRITLAWTDPAGLPGQPALDDPTRRLVNDLDISLHSPTGGVLRRAWALDPEHPELPAQATGNQRDNVERIDWTPTGVGEPLRLCIGAGALASAQDWSLLLTGVEPVAKLRMQQARNTAQLGDTLELDLELDGGVAVRGVRLELRWPAGALDFVDAWSGPLLLEGGLLPRETLLEEGIDHVWLTLDREDDAQGLNLPQGRVATVRLVVRSLSEIQVDLTGCRLIGVAGDTDQLLEWESIRVNAGQDPVDLEYQPGEGVVQP